MISTLVSIKQVRGGRFIAERFLLLEQRFIDQIKTGKFPLEPISAVGKVRGGKRLPRSSRYVSDGIPYVRSTDIRELRVDFSQVVHISPAQQKQLARYPLEYNDVVITIAGSIGSVGLVDTKFDRCHFNENLARITKINRLNPAYLAVYLNSRFGQAYIKYFTGGAVQLKLSLESINKIEVPIPPISIQNCIAQVMQDAYATRREKLAQAKRLYQEIDGYVLKELGIDLAKLQSRRSALVPICSIAGGRFDFEAVVTVQDINFNGTASTLLQEVVKQVNDRITPADDCPTQDVNYVGLGNITPNIGELIDFTPSKGAAILSSSPKFECGDILFGRMRPYLNKVWVSEFDGVCSGEAIVLRTDKRKVDPRFLQALLLSRITLYQVVPLQSGSSLPRVCASDVLNLKLPIPKDLKKQAEIGEEVASRRAEAKRLRAEAETVVTEAKARVERMILGEEEVP